MFGFQIVTSCLYAFSYNINILRIVRCFGGWPRPSSTKMTWKIKLEKEKKRSINLCIHERFVQYLAMYCDPKFKKK